MRPDYTEKSETFDHYRSFSKAVLEKYIGNFEDLASLRGGERILDAGAGTGRFAIPLSKKYRVVALDCSIEMIQKGFAKSRKVRWVSGDITRTPFKQKHFDCTLLAYVIHQTPDFNAVIEEMARLSPKCIIITTDMYRCLPSLIGKAFPGIIEIDSERFPLIEDLEGAFILTGFERVRARRILLEETLTKERFMAKIKHKYISTFDLISEAEFDDGLAKMEKLLADIPGDTINNRVQATFVSASRR